MKQEQVALDIHIEAPIPITFVNILGGIYVGMVEHNMDILECLKVYTKLTIGDGHQGIMGTAYGTYRFNKAKKEPEIVDIMRFPAECVNPPADQNADDWIKNGMKGAKC